MSHTVPMILQLVLFGLATSTILRGYYQHQGVAVPSSFGGSVGCYDLFPSYILRMLCSHDILPLNWAFCLMLEVVSTEVTRHIPWKFLTSATPWKYLASVFTVAIAPGLISVRSMGLLCLDVHEKVSELLARCECSWNNWLYPVMLRAAIVGAVAHAAMLVILVPTFIILLTKSERGVPLINKERFHQMLLVNLYLAAHTLYFCYTHSAGSHTILHWTGFTYRLLFIIMLLLYQYKNYTSGSVRDKLRLPTHKILTLMSNLLHQLILLMVFIIVAERSVRDKLQLVANKILTLMSNLLHQLILLLMVLVIVAVCKAYLQLLLVIGFYIYVIIRKATSLEFVYVEIDGEPELINNELRPPELCTKDDHKEFVEPTVPIKITSFHICPKCCSVCFDYPWPADGLCCQLSRLQCESCEQLYMCS